MHQGRNRPESVVELLNLLCGRVAKSTAGVDVSVVFFDTLRVKIRDGGSVKNKAVYLALGIQRDGTKDVLGLWIQQTERAKFWLAVMNELRNRGVQDIPIAVIDGLKGFPEAIAAVFPDTAVMQRKLGKR